jgi:hypothetical protein
MENLLLASAIVLSVPLAFVTARVSLTVLLWTMKQTEE